MNREEPDCGSLDTPARWRRVDGKRSSYVTAQKDTLTDDTKEDLVYHRPADEDGVNARNGDGLDETIHANQII